MMIYKHIYQINYDYLQLHRTQRINTGPSIYTKFCTPLSRLGRNADTTECSTSITNRHDVKEITHDAEILDNVDLTSCIAQTQQTHEPR